MLSRKDVESVVKHEVGHYILNRYNNIVPTAIHFRYNSCDSLNGDCKIQYNLYLDMFPEVSKLSYQRAMVLFAGAAAEFLNFESKKIDQRKAKLDFEEKEISDNAKFSEHLITYLICEEKIRSDPYPETLKERIKNRIFNEVFEIIEKYNELIKVMTDYILPKVIQEFGEGEVIISNDELNTITQLTSEFGEKNPSIWDLE